MDLSQIELRVAGLLSGDLAFVDAYQKGVDLHIERALQIFGGTTCTNEQRQVGKMVNFADLFRAGPDVIRKQVLAMSGIELDIVLCEAIVKSRRKHRPMLYAFQRDLILTAHASGRIELPFTGQSRYFMGGDKYDVNEIVNFPVQTTASNTLLSIQSCIHKEMESINARQPSIHMFLNIYDAIYFDTRDEETEEELKYMVSNAVEYVQHHGYWSMISEYYGNEIPLEYDWS
jgi:DNA polymerase-1